MTFANELGAVGVFRLSGDGPRGPSWRTAALWRGAVAALYESDPAFHGHDGDRLVHRYPRVQYRWGDEGPSMLVLGDAAQPAMRRPWPGTALRLGDREVTVVDVEWRARTIALRPAGRLLRYAFRSPWLPLNQENHKAFEALSPAAQRAELDRIAVGNLLGMFKDLGWRLAPEQRVFAAVEPAREVRCQVKGNPMLGLLGEFVTNWELPDDLAIGRSVSHGYGWFARVA